MSTSSDDSALNLLLCGSVELKWPRDLGANTCCQHAGAILQIRPTNENAASVLGAMQLKCDLPKAAEMLTTSMSRIVDLAMLCIRHRQLWTPQAAWKSVLPCSHYPSAVLPILNFYPSPVSDSTHKTVLS